MEKKLRRLPASKKNRKVSYLVRYLCTWTTCACESNNDLHVLSRDYCDIRRTLNSTPGPSRPHTMHISRYNSRIPRMWTDLGKTSLFSWYTIGIIYEVTTIQFIEYRWPRIICTLLLSPPITQWSIFMVNTRLFQAFRWAENGASVEQRENNKRAGIEKESIMSIALDYEQSLFFIWAWPN